MSEQQVGSNEFRDQRIENMRKLEEMGHNTWGERFERTAHLADIRATFEVGKTVVVVESLLCAKWAKWHSLTFLMDLIAFRLCSNMIGD